jgi:hypothetical protein
LAAVVGLSNGPNKIYPTIASDAIGTGDCARVSNSLHVLHVMQLVSAAKNLVCLLMDLPWTRTSIVNCSPVCFTVEIPSVSKPQNIPFHS